MTKVTIDLDEFKSLLNNFFKPPSDGEETINNCKSIVSLIEGFAFSSRIEECDQEDDKVDSVTLDFTEKKDAVKFFSGLLKGHIENGPEVYEFCLPYFCKNRRQEVNISWGKGNE